MHVHSETRFLAATVAIVVGGGDGERDKNTGGLSSRGTILAHPPPECEDRSPSDACDDSGPEPRTPARPTAKAL